MGKKQQDTFVFYKAGRLHHRFLLRKLHNYVNYQSNTGVLVYLVLPALFVSIILHLVVVYFKLPKSQE
jgi:hypothetical protein